MRVSSAAALLFLLVGASLARPQVDPATLLARDMHEGLLVAVDPYDDATRAKQRFGKRNPYNAGILAIEVFCRNNNDRPIRLNLESVRLLLAPPRSDRQRLEPLTVEDVIDRMVNKGGPNPTAPRHPFPGRRPRLNQSKAEKELAATLHALSLETDILPPRSTVHGFLFFDLGHHYHLLPYARLYLPDLKFIPNNQALMFFEVELAPAVRR